MGEAGGNIIGLEGFEAKALHLDTDIIVNCVDESQMEAVHQALHGLDGCEVLQFEDRTFAFHQSGKIAITSTMPLPDMHDLSMAYTPGVARVCSAIAADPSMAYTHTIKSNADAIVETVQRMAPGFGGTNLEDIAAPHCFEVEERLREMLDIPVFHDDQHGTAVVVTAALQNALRIVDKKMGDLRVAMLGVGASGTAIAKAGGGLSDRRLRGRGRPGSRLRHPEPPRRPGGPAVGEAVKVAAMAEGVARL